LIIGRPLSELEIQVCTPGAHVEEPQSAKLDFIFASKERTVLEPEDSPIGDMRYRRRDYAVIHRALERLLNIVSHWNRVATSHGASRPPYEDEEEHLSNMVEWGERELSDEELLNITVKGMSTKSLRLQKAALLIAAFLAEKEARKKSKEMPPAVADSMLTHARAFAGEANKINYPAHPILEELRQVLGFGSSTHEWDVFISHASEDKDAIARPLANALGARGLKVWFDEATLTLGDSLRQSIDRGLARSQYGIVILSEAFFSKHWPQRELDGLDAREVNGVKVILPVWHSVDQATVARHSPTLAGRLAVSTSRGMAAVVEEILRALKQ